MSSFTRRFQIRKMKALNVDKVPCPYGSTTDSGEIDDKGAPILVPVMVWPQFAPIEQVAA